MNKILNLLALLTGLMLASCAHFGNQPEKNDAIPYARIDSSISHFSVNFGGGCKIHYKRLDENWMTKRLAEMKTLGVDSDHILNWPSNSIIKASIDGDSLIDYIVITKSPELQCPQTPETYAIIAILGKNFKSYLIPDGGHSDLDWYPDGTYSVDDLQALSKDSINYTKYELPQISLEKEENITTIYLHHNRTVDSYNPSYYEVDKDKFEVAIYE